MATMSVIDLQIVDLGCTRCADRVLEVADAVPGVAHAKLDYQSKRLTVEIDARLVSETAVREAINRIGYHTAGDDVGPSIGLLAHITDMTPVTCCTSADRMQYELAHSAARRAHKDPADYPHGGYGGMDRDMSDPTMAAAMEHDMRKRFFIALVLTIPVIIFSPLGYNTLAIRPLHSVAVSAASRPVAMRTIGRRGARHVASTTFHRSST
jgi:Cu2+-exporting ATPase